jgi:predicted nuclease of predicted toxin-antitoxin system
LRLLLDEHLPPRVALELRRRGHDVVAATEREDLLGLADEELFRQASVERRALVTKNYSDFSRLLSQAAVGEVEHFGVIFVSPTLWRSLRGMNQLVAALEAFLEQHPAEDAISRGARWLGR